MDIRPSHNLCSRSMEPEDERSVAGYIPGMLEDTKASALGKALQQVSIVAHSRPSPAQAHIHADRSAVQSEQGPGSHLEEAHLDDAAALQIKEELEQAFLVSSPNSTTISEPDPNLHVALVPSKKRKHMAEEVSDESFEETLVAVEEAQRPFAPPKKAKKDKTSVPTSV